MSLEFILNNRFQLSLKNNVLILPFPAVSATEALDDDGLPHTLEHLIFLGSADYPYKGNLDIIANRCLANGTNAWTGMLSYKRKRNEND